MTKKVSTQIKKIVIIIALIMPVIIYFNFYNINDLDLEYSLGEHLKRDDVSIITQQKIANNDKLKVVYYETGELFGISLLGKGINSKYQVLDTYLNNSMIDKIEYEIKGYFYSIEFHENNLEIEKDMTVVREKTNLYRKIIFKSAIVIFMAVFLSFIICFTIIISSGGKYKVYDSNIKYDNQSFKQMKPW